MNKEMVWFARVPHGDAPKGVWFECGADLFEAMSTIKELMLEDYPFTVRFEKHRKDWANKFTEV